LASFNNRKGRGPEYQKHFKLKLKFLYINGFCGYCVVAKNAQFHSAFWQKYLISFHVFAENTIPLPPSICCLPEGGTRNLFLSPQSQFRNLKEALPQLFKEMLLRNRNSAIPQLQFFLKPAMSSPQLESFTSAIFGIFLAYFWPWSS
jgi:hypothetical protein